MQGAGDASNDMHNLNHAAHANHEAYEMDRWAWQAHAEMTDCKYNRCMALRVRGGRNAAKWMSESPSCSAQGAGTLRKSLQGALFTGKRGALRHGRIH